jgi:hypothetical protein
LRTPGGNNENFATADHETWDHGEWSETGQGPSGEPIPANGQWSAIDIPEGDVIKILDADLERSPTTGACYDEIDSNQVCAAMLYLRLLPGSH